MPPRLILNADDFGLTPGINRAIAELHQAHALTSATLMANGPAFDDAVIVAHENPTLAVGCHIVLVDGIPISPPHTIPTLAPNGRTLRPTLLDFAQAVLRNRIAPADIAREALAQLQRIQHAGIHPTHIDTHKHTHLFPAVARPLLQVLTQSGIPAIRNPFEPPATIALSHPSTLRRIEQRVLNRYRITFLELPQLRDAAVLTTQGTIGIAATGTLTPATLQALLQFPRSDPNSVYELCCHPGYNDAALDRLPTRLRESRNTERQALLTLIPQILHHEIPLNLISYADLRPTAHP